jgi:hypothetical protein
MLETHAGHTTQHFRDTTAFPIDYAAGIAGVRTGGRGSLR